MDVSAATALNQYTFQNTAKTSGPSAAVVQALAQAYTNSRDSAGTSAMSQVLTTISNAPLVNALMGLAGTDATAAAALQGNTTYGGLDSATASSLLSSMSSSSNQGFTAALNASTSMALAAYQASKTYPSTSTAPTATPTVSSVTAALQAAQAASFANAMNFLG